MKQMFSGNVADDNILSIQELFMSRKITGAIIGYGGMGGFHAEKMQTVRGIQLGGVYDISPQRNELARAKNIKTYDSREALLADPAIDIVVIATPNDVHKEIAIDALRAGKHIICEKPVTMDSKELREIIAASEKYGRIFTVHQNRRWDEDFKTIRKICESGKLGRVFRIESRVHGSRGIPGGWREEKKHGGGMILDWGVHLIDQMLTMMREAGNKPVSVFCTASYISNEECDDGFTAIVKFDRGPEWLLEVGTNTFVTMPRWYALGANGSAVINDWYCNGKITRIFNWDEKDVAPISAGAGLTRTMAPRNNRTVKDYKIRKVRSDWSEYYKNIVAALNGREDIKIKPSEVMESMLFIEALFKSIEEQQVVYFNNN